MRLASPDSYGFYSRLSVTPQFSLRKTRLRLDDFSEPVPDIALLKLSDDYYAARHPKPTDTLLVIEVADSSLLKDRNIKAASIRSRRYFRSLGGEY